MSVISVSGSVVEYSHYRLLWLVVERGCSTIEYMALDIQLIVTPYQYRLRPRTAVKAGLYNTLAVSRLTLYRSTTLYIIADTD